MEKNNMIEVQLAMNDDVAEFSELAAPPALTENKPRLTPKTLAECQKQRAAAKAETGKLRYRQRALARAAARLAESAETNGSNETKLPAMTATERVTPYRLRLQRTLAFQISEKLSKAAEEKSISETDYEQNSEQSSFKLGLQPQKILGATYLNGHRSFLIQFKSSDLAELVPATVAHRKIPQMIINFYENHLCWSSDED